MDHSTVSSSRTFYHVKQLGGGGNNGKLCFARDGLIYYPQEDSGETTGGGGGGGRGKVKIRWASVASTTKFDPESLQFEVHHVRGKSYIFQINNLQDLQRMEQDCSRRLETYSERQQEQQQEQSQQQDHQHQHQHQQQQQQQQQQQAPPEQQEQEHQQQQQQEQEHQQPQPQLQPQPQPQPQHHHHHQQQQGKGVARPEPLDNSAMHFSAATSSTAFSDDDDDDDDDDSVSFHHHNSDVEQAIPLNTTATTPLHVRRSLRTRPAPSPPPVPPSTRRQRPSSHRRLSRSSSSTQGQEGHGRPTRPSIVLMDSSSNHGHYPSFQRTISNSSSVARRPIMLMDGSSDHPSLHISPSTHFEFEEESAIINFENEVLDTSHTNNPELDRSHTNPDLTNSDSYEDQHYRLFGSGGEIKDKQKATKSTSRGSSNTHETQMESEVFLDEIVEEAAASPSSAAATPDRRKRSRFLRFLPGRRTKKDRSAGAADDDTSFTEGGIRRRTNGSGGSGGGRRMTTFAGTIFEGLENEIGKGINEIGKRVAKKRSTLRRQSNGRRLTAAAGPRSRAELRTLLRAAIIVAGMAAGVQEYTEEYPLSPDAYSILYTVGYSVRSLFFAWFVIIVQAGMLLVTFLDLMAFPHITKHAQILDYYETFAQRLHIPPGASVYVTASQFFGFLLTMLIMVAEGDFVTGAGQLIRGYNKKITEEFPKATRFRWLFTSLLQASTGALLLINSFILSMQSTSVIDLALNLTALYFVQEIDDKAFHIAKDTGLLGPDIKNDCEAIENYKVVTRSDYRAQTIRRKRILICVMAIGLFVPYFVVVVMQNTGVFLCHHLFLQFGDAYHPEMAHYSGLFHSQGFSWLYRKDQRTYYLDETNTFQIGYCDSENAWTVSRAEDGTCDYIFKSPETETFDIMEVANEDWVVKTEESGDVDVDWLKIKCNDCSEDTCDPMHGTCSDSNDMCICNEGRHGINCQYQESCEWYALDQRTKDALASVPGAGPLLSYEYRSASHKDPKLSFYGRPIYVPADRETSTYQENIDSFIVFTGRRWVIYSLPEQFLPRLVEINGKPSNWTSEAFFEYHNEYSTGRNSFWAMTRLTLELHNLRPLFFSSPVDYGEDSDGIDLSTVTWMFGSKATAQVTVVPSDRQDISWMFPPAKEPVPGLLTNATNSEVNLTIISANPNDGHPMSAKFLCPECHMDEDCLNGGTCSLSDSSGGVCACPEFYDGTVCERLKNCVEAGGSCSNAGTCNEATGICHCDEGSYGRHCQLHSKKSHAHEEIGF